MKNRGITLIVLIVTIIVLMILSTVTLTIGISQINKINLKSFYTKLEIAQEGIEKISATDETYKDKDGKEIKLKELGAEPTQEQKSLIESLGDFNSSNFKYFTAEEIEEDLEIDGVDLDLLIDFENKIVISAEGIEIDGKMYYMLESNKYSVTLDESKNTGEIDFNYTISQYGSNSYKIKIEPKKIGDITEGTVEYRKTGMQYWNVAKNNEIIIKNLTDYDIKYTDVKGNTVTKTITISLDSNDNIIATEKEE